jgi:hypothetical protein
MSDHDRERYRESIQEQQARRRDELAAQPKPEQIITTVYLLPDGMVACFDQHGQRMPEYEGSAADGYWERAKRAAPVTARFHQG